MRRIALLCPLLLALCGVSAEAAGNGTIKLKNNTRFDFADIQCVTRTTTYAYITCVSSGKYEVAVSRQSIIVVRARDGHVIYHTPY